MSTSIILTATPPAAMAARFESKQQGCVTWLLLAAAAAAPVNSAEPVWLAPLADVVVHVSATHLYKVTHYTVCNRWQAQTAS